MEKKRLIIMETQTIYGSFWTCMPAYEKAPDEFWESMGHTVVYVEKNEAERILKAYGASVTIQAELAILQQKERRKRDGADNGSSGA